MNVREMIIRFILGFIAAAIVCALAGAAVYTVVKNNPGAATVSESAAEGQD